MKKLLFQILAAGLGLWLATIFAPGVEVKLFSDSSFFGIGLTEQWQIFFLLGIILGLLNFFIKPILSAIALPLKIITLGLFSFAINIALIWILDVMFKELYIPLWLPLIYTALIIGILNSLSSIISKND